MLEEGLRGVFGHWEPRVYSKKIFFMRYNIYHIKNIFVRYILYHMENTFVGYSRRSCDLLDTWCNVIGNHGKNLVDTWHIDIGYHDQDKFGGCYISHHKNVWSDTSHK
jgi:hypothetical protein